MPKTLNTEPISHMTPDMTFLCDRGDLSEPVLIITGLGHPSPERLAADVAGFIGWHALTIRPQLKGFMGYDTITFEFEESL